MIAMLNLRDAGIRAGCSLVDILNRGAARACLAIILAGFNLDVAGAGAIDLGSTNSGLPEVADFSIEQLVNLKVASVYGASKYDQKVTQAPSSVSIVTADEIKKFGYRTLAD